MIRLLKVNIVLVLESYLPNRRVRSPLVPNETRVSTARRSRQIRRIDGYHLFVRALGGSDLERPERFTAIAASWAGVC